MKLSANRYTMPAAKSANATKTSNTSNIMNAFVASIDNEKKYDLKELNKLLTEAYNANKGKTKTTKEPTAYNIYMKDKMNELKQTHPDMNAKDLMKMAASSWTEHKEKINKNEEKNDNPVPETKTQEPQVEEKSVRERVQEIISNTNKESDETPTEAPKPAKKVATKKK